MKIFPEISDFYLCQPKSAKLKGIISFLLRNVPRKYLQLGSHYFLKVYALFLKGKGSYCPVCNSEFRKFLPYGRLEPRDNALCPNCLSLERHRLLWLYLNDETDFFTRDHKFLHIAPEVCFMDKFEKKLGDRYITADIESPLAKVKMDIHEIPFPENEFSIVMCNHVLEHVNDDIVAMKEIYRVLQPGGWAILQVPFFPPLPEITEEDTSITDPKERELRFGQDDHVRKYGKDYATRLQSTGFKVVEANPTAGMSNQQIQHLALPKGEIVYQCFKP